MPFLGLVTLEGNLKPNKGNRVPLGYEVFLEGLKMPECHRMPFKEPAEPPIQPKKTARGLFFQERTSRDWAEDTEHLGSASVRASCFCHPPRHPQFGFRV